MREHTYPASYEAHLRRRVKELEREVARLEQQNQTLRQHRAQAASDHVDTLKAWGDDLRARYT